MHEELGAAVQREERVIAEVFQPAAMVSMQMTDRDGVNSVEIERFG